MREVEGAIRARVKGAACPRGVAAKHNLGGEPMLEISRKWGMLALALATGAALAAPVALRSTQAYADDGIEVVQEGEPGIDLAGATPLRNARVVGKDYEVELGDGSYFYEEGNAFSHGADGFTLDLSDYMKSNGVFTLCFPEWVAPGGKPAFFRVELKEYGHK